MKRVVLVGFAFALVVGVVALTERPAYSHKPITTPILFNREIAQIFQRKCFQCHSENNLGMALTTYQLARPWARAIREEVLERRMPPWGAVAGYGHFANDMGITQREMDIILSWADGGAPSGVLKAGESVPPVFVASAPMWETGPPDEVLSPDAPVTIEANTGNTEQRLELRAAFAEPRALKSIAFKPGDRRVVRYAAVYESTTRRWLFTWTPWHTVLTLSEGAAYRLPARARFTIEVGYRAVEETVSDKSELGLYFGDARGAQDSTPFIVTPAAALDIKPSVDAQRVRAESVIADNRRALAIWPELGDGVKSFEVSAVSPEGVVDPLLWVKDFRADWRSSYVFRAPVPLRRGTRIVATTYFVNKSSKALSVKPRVTIVTQPDAGAASPTREGRNVERKRDR